MKIKLNVIVVVSIAGLILAGAEAPTLLLQVTASSLGVVMFAGGLFAAVRIVRNNGHANLRGKGKFIVYRSQCFLY